MLERFVSECDFLAFDFDGTLGQTSEPSPTGLTVTRAYALALDQVFGVRDLLHTIGGLRNRAPIELADEVLSYRPSLARRAREYYDESGKKLRHVVPPGKGVDLEREHADDVKFCAELIVRVKLEQLLAEQRRFGEESWPRAFDGVPEFLSGLEKPWGILSTGHDLFIERSLQLWNVPRPEFMLTDDDVRGLSIPLERKTKPSAYLFDLVLEQTSARGHAFPRHRIGYFGDDIKDRQLADNAGVNFFHFNPSGMSPLGANVFQRWESRAAVAA